MIQSEADTIVALATPPGKGGVGVIRISGPLSREIYQKITQKAPIARKAVYTNFYSIDGQILDQGLSIFFPNPHSFTGEDIFEIQGHGGPVVMDMLIETVLALGARTANPGEFSERAFLNGKIDLAQAEAISDLINSQSRAAALGAVKSLQGNFSNNINKLLEDLIHLRVYVEAALDFPEEEIDFLADDRIKHNLLGLTHSVENLISQSKQGVLLKDGINLVIIGQPNVGKSSLLNKLSGTDSAIVTDIAGTTRDIVSEEITIDGLPIHIFDTAGLRKTEDKVEQIGIQKAWKQTKVADRVLMLFDVNQSDWINLYQDFCKDLPDSTEMSIVFNKIDITSQAPQLNTIHIQEKQLTAIYLSAKTGEGIDLLKEHIKNICGFKQQKEGIFLSRRRHLEALIQCENMLKQGFEQLAQHQAGELLAEDLKQAQEYLSSITGEFHSDDLLGEIFSGFCIGK